MESAKKHLCMNCMHEMGEYEVCAFCGWSEGLPPREAYHLYPRTILNDRYEIGVTIGFGGFGIIYRAWDRMLGMQVAIKEYYPSGLVNRAPMEKKVVVYSGSRYDQFQQGKQRFLDEAQNMAKFGESRYIVNVIDFFEENGTAYIVMDDVPGVTLAHQNRARAKDAKPDAAALMRSFLPLMESLALVHDAGIIHRDVSPENIIISPKGGMTLIDFGSAGTYEREEDERFTTIAKDGFAPEEQYREDGKQGPYSDVYGLCATIYACLTGIVPDSARARRIMDDLKAPSQLGVRIAPEMEAALMRGLAVDSTRRFRPYARM